MDISHYVGNQSTMYLGRNCLRNSGRAVIRAVCSSGCTFAQDFPEVEIATRGDALSKAPCPSKLLSPELANPVEIGS